MFHQPINPSGLCMCGCGQQVKRTPETRARLGYRKGDFVRYVVGHNRRAKVRRGFEITAHPAVRGCTAVPVLAFGGKAMKFALVDTADVARLGERMWREDVRGYAVATDGLVPDHCTVQMHRCLFDDIPQGLEVDHINRRTMDNRRSNLRVVTPQMNRQNIGPQARSKTQLRGVSWAGQNCKSRPWRARCTVNGKEIVGGNFATMEEAAAAARALRAAHMAGATD